MGKKSLINDKYPKDWKMIIVTGNTNFCRLTTETVTESANLYK